MKSGTSHQSKTQEQIKNDLAEVLRERQIEWIRASDQDRDAARQRFMVALHLFNSFALQESEAHPTAETAASTGE